MQSYALGTPTADHLLTLTKLNVYRALVSNTATLGIPLSQMWDDEALSPFTHVFPLPPMAKPQDGKSLPLALQPTVLQRTTPHHPWIDFFPLPRMRDNLIRALSLYDEDALCVDILGFWEPGSRHNALLVWGDPADPRSWEVSESFLRNWRWVLHGCPELFHSTNYWRAKRGEKSIRVTC
ncbi:hypothetical protein ASPZODRAFT_137076 [Penicilliopsis zonata CBS 506.65]|uniref:Uncharacterized protein n=1 Tax=Penicilliopsis zonata CBS 506.65 TaxID=1073090 RepID=A0A1L9S690_9EURO|nr:hypothetical protein ASPZODRAFT_137076 [Penicilliopsis zonata CBS 506.65]OJJ42689.1 hypothetical protein ASPZODRAFT_137076 [Penicilliopsis zonata CBS 506.65]